MAKLVWRVKLVTERHPGVTTETELAFIERDADVGFAELGLRLDEAKRLTAELQAEMVPAQMAALGECPRACEACGRRLGAKGQYGARFRSLFGDVPVRVRRLFVAPAGARAGAGRHFEMIAGKTTILHGLPDVDQSGCKIMGRNCRLF